MEYLYNINLIRIKHKRFNSKFQGGNILHQKRKHLVLVELCPCRYSLFSQFCRSKDLSSITFIYNKSFGYYKAD